MDILFKTLEEARLQAPPSEAYDLEDCIEVLKECRSVARDRGQTLGEFLFNSCREETDL